MQLCMLKDLAEVGEMVRRGRRRRKESRRCLGKLAVEVPSKGAATRGEVGGEEGMRMRRLRSWIG